MKYRMVVRRKGSEKKIKGIVTVRTSKEIIANAFKKAGFEIIYFEPVL